MGWFDLIDKGVAYATEIGKRLQHYETGPLYRWLLFAIVMAIFIAPGYWWASWLHHRGDYSRSFRVVLGFAWSLAVFALVGWPFLWLGGSFFVFLGVIGATWSAFLLVSTYLYFMRSPTPFQAVASDSISRQNAQTANLPECAISLIGVTCYFALAGLLLYAAWWLRAHEPAPNSDEALRAQFDTAWINLARQIAMLFGFGILFGVAAKLFLGRALAFTAEDNERPSRFTIALVVIFVSVQTFTAMIFDRPDWDDCFYLAAVLDYQEAEQLNDQEPTHREGFPMQAFDRLLAWELWGAVLCRLTGLNPMAVFHTLLPAFLIPFAYLAYARMVGEFIPRRWVPLAILGIAAYHMWGAASHNTPANFLLNRTGQGKAVMLHIGLPLMVALQTRFMRQPGWANWLSLCAGVVFSLAASSSTVFLAPMLLGCLGIALSPIIIGPVVRWHLVGGRAPRLWLPDLFVVAVGSATAILPPLAYGLLIRHEVLNDKMIVTEELIRAYEHGSWFTEVTEHVFYGTWEMFWVLLVPMIALLAWNYRRLAYFVVFPVVLLATFSNPLVYHKVAQSLTSYPTYFRVLWLFPVQAGLGVFLALFARLAARTVQAVWNAVAEGITLVLPRTRGIQMEMEERIGANFGGWRPRPWDYVAGIVAVIGVGYSVQLDSWYVWGHINVGMIQAHKEGPRPGEPPVVQNLMKMPGDLVFLANDLLTDDKIKEHRILTMEEVTNFLTPYARDFRFVQTRDLYTLGMADSAGRFDEGEKRFFVSRLLYNDFRIQDPWEPAISVRNGFYWAGGYMPRDRKPITAERMRRMCDDLRVRYAITFKPDPSKYWDSYQIEKLKQVGFSNEKRFDYGEFTLWVREIDSPP